jgi:MSHA biogenesis protein MshL
MKRHLLAACAIPLGVAGCVNPSANTIKGTKALPAYTVPSQPQKQAPPPKDPEAYRYSDSGRAYSLTLKNADLRDVLILLSKDSGVSIVAERGLRGTVQIEAKNKKLGELLYTILKPLGYTASVENGMILVGRPKLTTRTFRMNYLKDTRNSSSNMSVSGFAASGSGSVSVSTNGKSDYWGAIESSLEMFVFGTSGKGKREGGGYIVGDAEKKLPTGAQKAEVTASSSGEVQHGANPNFSATTKISAKRSVEEEPDTMLSNTQINDNLLKQLVVNEMAGVIQITDFPENLDKIASFLTDVEEGSKRQVLIQAHIMEVNLSDSYAMGIDWKTIIDKSTSFSIAQAIVPTTSGAASAGSNVFKISATGSNFNVMLDAMKEQGNVNMLSSPKISALNNQKAVIKLTTKEVSWVSTKTTSTTTNGSDTFTTTPQIDEVGIFLDVTPQIGPDGSVVMQIHPSVSEIREISTSPDKTSTKPVVDVREIDTMVDAKAGETIVIAGLISDKLLEAKRGIPLLGDIPYLGALFSYNKQTRTKSELVIMMTPYFLNTKSIDEIRRDHEKRMQNIGGEFHLINNLGSMITEKSSRDWIMHSEPNRIAPASAAEEPPAAKRGVDSPAPVPTVVPAPPQARAVTPPQETVKPVVVTERIVATPPETLQQLEQQQTMIERLKADVASAEERIKRERQENEAKSAEERRLADAARQAQLKRIEELQNSTTNQAAASVPPPLSAQPKAAEVQQPTAPAAAVQTVSVTTDREQTLYRSAVTAYKIGDCAESIKSFDLFTKAYPESPFISDAAYYRKDCADRLASSSK